MHRSSEKQWHAPLLMGLCVLVYVPFAGTHGLWDPWETHYGEVARQMAMRGDVITLHYPCSPLEGVYFWSKPVLTFWLEALSITLFGLRDASGAALTESWRAEWACRLPSLLLGLLGVYVVFALVRGRRGLFAGLVLATSPSWLLLSRQAMSDMPFVVPMTIALALVARALLFPDDTPPSRLGFFTLLGLASVPQLVAISIQLHGAIRLGAHRLALPGFVIMSPYMTGLVIATWLCAKAKTRAQLDVCAAWICCALATLAKGPAGLALPGLVLVVFLVTDGRWREIFTKLELVRGPLLFIVVAFPWYHAMHVRYGMPFWNELIGDNYLHRAAGRHGDRGTFEYYVQWLGYGTFPWSGLAAVGVLRAFRDPKARLARFAMAWLLVDFIVLTLVQTKFHHYLLPMVPAVAILVGLLVDNPPSRMELVLVALPITVLCGIDLAHLPARITWLFDYDYVNVPNVGRLWPTEPRFAYGATIAGFTAIAAIGLFLPARAYVAIAMAWSAFIADRMIVDLSPHWSQKHVIAAYYRQRRSADEPLLVWELFWHGENFYTANAIYASEVDAERTVFLGDRAAEKLRAYVAAHAGRRAFFLVERVKLDGLRRLVPDAHLHVVDESNNKLVLAEGTL